MAFFDRLIRYTQRPQPRMGLKDFALELGQQRPCVAWSGPAAGNAVQRSLNPLEGALTVPTGALPLAYVLGNAPIATGNTVFTGLSQLPSNAPARDM